MKRRGKRSRPTRSLRRGPNLLPNRQVLRLVFTANPIINHAGFQYANVRYEPTYAYDVDPLVGSTAMPFFTEMASIYRYYRVSRFSWHVQATNTDATTGVLWVCPVNFDPTANTTNFPNYMSNALAKMCTFGYNSGAGQTCSVRGSASVAGLGGVRNTGQIDAYSAPTSGSAPPSNNIYLGIGFVTNSNMTNGVQVNVCIKITLAFFELNAPST